MRYRVLPCMYCGMCCDMCQYAVPVAVRDDRGATRYLCHCVILEGLLPVLAYRYLPSREVEGTMSLRCMRLLANALAQVRHQVSPEELEDLEASRDGTRVSSLQGAQPGVSHSPSPCPWRPRIWKMSGGALHLISFSILSASMAPTFITHKRTKHETRESFHVHIHLPSRDGPNADGPFPACDTGQFEASEVLPPKVQDASANLSVGSQEVKSA